MRAYDDVTDWLIVGGDLDFTEHLTGQTYDETIADLMMGRDVTHVLDLRGEYEDKIEWMIAGLPEGNYCHAPIVDSRSHTPSERWFRTIEDFVGEFWRTSCHGDRLYVHCMMGVNRGPSAAMLSMLTVEPEMHPWQAFLQIREVRPVAGLVYAGHVGLRHLHSNPETAKRFAELLDDYWTPERIDERRQMRFDFTGGLQYGSRTNPKGNHHVRSRRSLPRRR